MSEETTNPTPAEPMQKYYGTKLLAAKPMTKLEYNQFRGWELPSDENGSDEGYLVEYLDGGKPNVEGYAGYLSWSPKDVFEAAYQSLQALSFGHAICAMKAGEKVARAGWNRDYLQLKDCDDNNQTIIPSIYMVAGGENLLWKVEQADIFANDWQVLNDAVPEIAE